MLNLTAHVLNTDSVDALTIIIVDLIVIHSFVQSFISYLFCDCTCSDDSFEIKAKPNYMHSSS